MLAVTGHAWRFDAIGTSWEIATDSELEAAARAAVTAVIDDVDEFWSRFRADSVVSRLSREGGRVALSARHVPLLEAYAALSDATAGAVNPLVGASLEALGYGPTLSLVPAAPVAAPIDWRSRVRWDDESLEAEAGAIIDVGACGKGLLVDLIGATLGEHGVERWTVDGSGDLLVAGRVERIALEHPFDPTRAIGVAEVADGALCASATNRRSWGGGLHHVLDARTGAPVREIAATWAVATDALHADALATALFFDGGPRLADAWQGDWVRMFTDGRVEHAPRTRMEIFR